MFFPLITAICWPNFHFRTGWTTSCTGMWQSMGALRASAFTQNSSGPRTYLCTTGEYCVVAKCKFVFVLCLSIRLYGAGGWTRQSARVGCVSIALGGCVSIALRGVLDKSQRTFSFSGLLSLACILVCKSEMGKLKVDWLGPGTRAAQLGNIRSGVQATTSPKCIPQKQASY